VQPRCAYVDVSPVTLSTETRVALLPELTKDTTLSVIRSRRLDILFTNDTYLLVKTATQQQNQKPIVYELKKNTIMAITWCE
jgi:hypothetical protein